jgi:hypothetical protein
MFESPGGRSNVPSGRLRSAFIAAGMGLALLCTLLGTTGCDRQAAHLREVETQTGFPKGLLNTIADRGDNLRQLEGFDAEGGPTKAPGVTIDVSSERAPQTARRLQESMPPDYLAYVSERNFGLGGAPDQVSVLKVSEPWDALRVMGTNGWNYDIGPEDIIARLVEWDQRFGLTLRGAGFDWLEAGFKRAPDDMREFGEEVYEFCPDVVEQGTGTVEALSVEMTRTNSVYLWWD